ncbi:MAG: NADH-quinone oxidoreductase subunit N [Pseudomonadales bacterium]|nr:NADH-quinone oxidoreductase subunit N [Pseudomonadales bacterium]NRA16535.1 NADH-quinone oxidoreductase subunit N [Oceanospirillaceae bacterium]
MIAAVLPWIVISATALIVMLLTAIKRDHLYISIITSLGLFIAMIVQTIKIETTAYENNLISINSTVALLSALLILLALLLSSLLYPWLKKAQEPSEEYYLLFLLATQGALIVAASSHFASFFLGLELMSLSLVAMVAYVDKSSKALEAGIKYFVLSALASAFMLMAIAIIYLYSGTLNFSEILTQLSSNQVVAENGNNLVLSTAIVLLLVGVAFKLSLAPCHLWVADLFEGAPLASAAFLATLAKAAIFILLIRLFEDTHWYQQSSVITILSMIAAASMLIGNLLALLQNNILRLLAYSSIAHFGYILLALLAIAPSSPLAEQNNLSNEAAIFYLIAYLVTVLGIFAILMLLIDNQQLKDFKICSFKGLFWHSPGTAMVLAVLLLSLAGIPLTIGFVGKFYLTLAAVNSQLWWLLAVLIVSSIIGLFYYLRIILSMLEKTEQQGNTAPASILNIAILALISLAVIGLGVFPGQMALVIQRIVVS